MKKTLALVLALLMLACTFTGVLAEETREDYEITYMIPGVKDSSSLDNPIGQIIYDKFGIIINLVGYAGDWEERCAMWLAGNDYPDMVQLQGNTMVKKYIEAGAVLNLSELAEKCNAQNFLTFHAQSIPYWKLATGTDDLYKYEANCPDMEVAEGPMFDMLVRSDILEEQGWPELLTDDDYIAVLKKAMEDHPTTENGDPTIGITFAGAEDWMLTTILMLDRGGYTECNSGLSVFWNNQKDVFEDKFSNIYFKEGLKFLNRMYQEGILDEEIFTTDSATVTEQLQSGTALSTWYVTWEQGGANQALREAGKENMEYVIMPNTTKLQLDNGEKRCIRILDTYDWQSVVITKNAKYPERIMELLDWASTEEGQVLLGWGIEGVHYTIDENGLRQVTPESIACMQGTGDEHFNDGVGYYYFLGLSSDYDENKQIYNRVMDGSVYELTVSDRTKEVYSHYGWEKATDPWQNNDKFDFEYVHTGLAGTVALNPTSDESALDTKLSEYIYKHMAQLILAESDEEFESMYDEFLAEYQSFGPQTVVDAYNAVYDGIKADFAEASK